MKFKTEIEIRQLEAKELSAYTFDFIKHFAVENPNLSRLAEKVSTEPRLVSSVKTYLISEHNSRKIWEGEVLEEIEDGVKNKVEKALNSLVFRKANYKTLNETAYSSLKENISNIFITLIEQDPARAKYIIKALIKTGLFRGVAISDFDNLLDNLDVQGEEFRPMLHKLASLFRGKDFKDLYARGLFKITGASDEQMSEFEKDVKAVIKETVEATSQIIKGSNIKSDKSNSSLQDRSWRDMTSHGSELVEYLQNILDQNIFELEFERKCYFRIDLQDHKNIKGAEEILGNIRDACNLLMDLYNADFALKHSRPKLREQNQKSYDEALLKYLEFGALDNLAPEQQLIFWHMLTAGMQKHILKNYEKAFDTQDVYFLDLLEKLKIRYEAFREYDSQFLDKSKINIKSVKLTLETGSPLTFAIEAGLQDEVKRMADQHKYLTINSKSSFAESANLPPSEFAASLKCKELEALLAIKEKEVKKFRSAPIGMKVVVNEKVKKQAKEALDRNMSDPDTGLTKK